MFVQCTNTLIQCIAFRTIYFTDVIHADVIKMSRFIAHHGFSDHQIILFHLVLIIIVEYKCLNTPNV